MALANYGLLTGILSAHTNQDGDNPHDLLVINTGKKQYRVAINVRSTPGLDAPAQLQFQVIPDLCKANAKAKALAAAIQNQNQFTLIDGTPITGLDFVHDGILNMGAFKTIPRDSGLKKNPFHSAMLAATQKALKTPGTFVAVFGTGYGGTPSSDPVRAAFGFTGVENVHMNQGTHYEVGRHLDHHYWENGPHQDGAILFVFSDGVVQGFFCKFQSQDNQTDGAGNPIRTNVPQLNATPAPVAKMLTSGVAKRKKKAAAILAAAPLPSVPPPHAEESTKPSTKFAFRTPAVSSPPPSISGFVFADPPDAIDPLTPFKPDDDSNVDTTFVDQFAKHGVPEPVPGPRGGQYPIMALESVIGTAAVKAIQKSGQIVIHMAGDTGAPEASKLPNEKSVAELMEKDFQGTVTDQPTFFYHLGDVVYYFGEQEYYYSQFYSPYQNYPRPIFAIPGNHDGVTYSEEMVSLDPFIKAFVDSAPNHWVGAGGISRTTMTQPGVYFTLDAPFVSIIGLYSNCSESYGYLDEQQTLFLYKELVRLKPKRESGEIAAVLLAVHHPPMSYSPSKASSQSLRNDIDKACNQASFWPDAVFSGHAHVYQRMTRTVSAAGANRQIPHIICGAGGYTIQASQEVDKIDMKLQDTSDPQFRLHQFLAHFGYLKLTISPTSAKGNGTLRIEFLSPNINLGGTADACVLDLETHLLV